MNAILYHTTKNTITLTSTLAMLRQLKFTTSHLLDELKFIRKFCNALVVMGARVCSEGSTQRSALRLPALALAHY
ncbi:hypothetical protein T4B_1401 [Trichinella pseudospiralis]|uniref:Uncharacterized protein n=1 Tax=Trichinella pseudospiralis TaxID=6337 RepID=A0A0V1F091_TRIPS|nr:hypothetical protein T4A_9835 [Trichinella pseudospiralis]KRZ35061.1 hypothetical protein T4B_1401 [Trichinella pseudospiralis]KRZ43959.1 hypothetical protein T4C_2608 [Trichinella pseudospiralis]